MALEGAPAPINARSSERRERIDDRLPIGSTPKERGQTGVVYLAVPAPNRNSRPQMVASEPELDLIGFRARCAGVRAPIRMMANYYR